MQQAYVVTGTLVDDHTVTLDEAVPLGAVKVRVVVEPLDDALQRPYEEVVAEIRERQRMRGHQSPTRDAVDAYLRVERDSWE